MTETGGSQPPQPEQTFFDDPAFDRLFGVVMALATEVYVQKDRLAALERHLVAAGHIDPGALTAEPSAAEIAAAAAERDSFVAHLMDPLLGQAVSRTAPGGRPPEG